MTATLKDIARESGYSPDLVSRALRGKGCIAAKTLAKVREIAARLDYVPNRNAQSLRYCANHEIAIVIGNPDELDLKRIAAIQDFFMPHGYTVKLYFTRNNAVVPDENFKLLKRIAAQRPVGVIVMPCDGQDALKDFLDQSGINSIFVASGLEEREDFVHIDRKVGLCEAIRHLLDNGYDDIMFVGKRVRKTFEEAAALTGIKYSVKVREPGRKGVSFLLGRALGREIAAARLKPRAVQAATDILASGLLYSFAAAGIRVPEDIAVVGFDNRDFSEFVYPPLTTIALPNEEVGNAAAAMLLSKIEKRGDDIRHVVLPTALVVREST